MFEDYSFFSFCKLLRGKKKCFLNKPGVLRILVNFLRYNKKLDTQTNMVAKNESTEPGKCASLKTAS